MPKIINQKQMVRYIGKVINSDLGRVMWEADILWKNGPWAPSGGTSPSLRTWTPSPSGTASGIWAPAGDSVRLRRNAVQARRRPAPLRLRPHDN